MYGDSARMRSRAGELREAAADLRTVGDQLVSQLDAIGWSGRAAESMRVRMQDRRAALRDAAARYDSASEAVTAHSAQVDRLTEQIAEIEKAFHDALAEAKTRVARLASATEGEVSVEPSDEDRLLLEFEPPPPGHKAWLDVEVPS